MAERTRALNRLHGLLRDLLPGGVVGNFRPIEVAYHRFLPGEIETPPFNGPVVNLHPSAPHRLVQRQHDLAREGLVATNDAAVTPAGVPDYWHTDATSEDISMLLEEDFVRRVAQEVGPGLDRIEIVPVFSAPDPQIGCIGLSLLSEMDTGGLLWDAESLEVLLALDLLKPLLTGAQFEAKARS